MVQNLLAPDSLEPANCDTSLIGQGRISQGFASVLAIHPTLLGCVIIRHFLLVELT